ncbi:hypothetical protein VNO77_44447 [Canavalia gladiata]|uniref:Uncharacterized protein n=1 Tax=Canavalia gladiata TaxID=3824 RepID=A0AAN9PNT5_CANGL
MSLNNISLSSFTLKLIWREIHQWSPTEVVKDRLVSVRCIGISIHAWCTTDFFTQLASQIGRRFVKVDQPTLGVQRLDFGQILVHTRSWKCINTPRPVSRSEFDEILSSVAVLETDFPLKEVEVNLGDKTRGADNNCLVKNLGQLPLDPMMEGIQIGR